MLFELAGWSVGLPVGWFGEAGGQEQRKIDVQHTDRNGVVEDLSND